MLVLGYIVFNIVYCLVLVFWNLLMSVMGKFLCSWVISVLCGLFILLVSIVMRLLKFMMLSCFFCFVICCLINVIVLLMSVKMGICCNVVFFFCIVVFIFLVKIFIGFSIFLMLDVLWVYCWLFKNVSVFVGVNV